MDNRSTILERALELFAAKGYDAVGVQEIVDASGITKPTLYHYFGSKQGLLKALLDAHYLRLIDELRSAADYQRDLPLTLRRVAKAYFRFSQDHPVFYRMQLSLYFAPAGGDSFQAVMKLNEAQFQIIEGLFLQAARDHGNMKGRHRLYAASFLGTINNCIGLALNGFLTLTDPLIERAVHQFEHGIYS
jgi:AcrR family transcriptional regulator